MYKFNEELCRQLSNGDIACKYDNGNLEMLSALLKKCAPKHDNKPRGSDDFYIIGKNGFWYSHNYTKKPTIPLSDFIVKDNKPFEWTDELVKEFALQTKVNGASDWGYTQIEQFKASKQRKPLFTTEDGNQIFKGDVYWYVEVDNNFDITSTIACSSEQQIPECKDFSTESAAREYVRLNKPEYSLNDVGDAWEKLCHEAFTYDQLITELENLKQ